MFDLFATKEVKRMHKFYVVTTGESLSPSSAMGFATLKDAAKYASSRTNMDGKERDILQRVRVVRRKPQPVVVEPVK
jgi:hypothetical protein